jgi:hypothetical protein
VAILTSQNVFRVYSDGKADVLVLYALRNVTTGDTFVSSSDFLSVKQAIVLGTTTNMAFVAGIQGTTLTIPAGLSGDAGWMLVWGASA